jgi:2-methylcitrate dehydratase PrpD
VAAALAVGRLVGFSRDELRSTIAVACSSAAGLRANFGTMIKPLHSAHAARAAVEAALLVTHGFSGVHNPLEHQFGFFKAYGGDTVPAEAGGWLLSKMRRCEAALLLTFKPYPCCGEATSVVEAALKVRQDVPAEVIARIEIHLTRFAREILEFDRPVNADEARFSAPYCASSALVFGRLGIMGFDTEARENSVVQRLIDVSHVTVDGSVSGHGGGVTVTTEDGSQIREIVTTPKGHASVGMPVTDAKHKFEECTTSVLGAAGVARAYAALAAWQGPDPVLDWTELLTVDSADALRDR